MHVILIAAGTAGYTLPYVGWAQALRSRGHSVLLIGSRYLQSAAQEQQLEFISIEQESQSHSRFAAGMLPLMRILRAQMMSFTRNAYDTVRERHIPGETVLAAPNWLFGARIAAEKLNLPLATVHLQPFLMLSAHEPGIIGGGRLPKRLQPLVKSMLIGLADRTIGSELNAYRRELGLPAVRKIVRGWSTSPDLVVGFFPEWFAGRQPDWPPQTMLAGFPLFDSLKLDEESASVGRFLDAGDPPLLFTQSTLPGKRNDFVEKSITAARLLGRRALFLTGNAQGLPSVSGADVGFFRFVPLSKILPRVPVFVHHGGMGALAQALCAGVPQITVPKSMDQPDNSRRLERLGVSINIPPRRYEPKHVAASIEKLLASPEVKERCRYHANLMAAEKPFEQACLALEQLHARR